MSGTYSPIPGYQYPKNDGTPAASYQLFTYVAGTSTKVATYSDVDLTTANTNPIILDSAGRATIFLDPGVTYKYVLAPDTDTDPPANPEWTRDNIQPTPESEIQSTVPGTAGEALSAGECVYLSEGDGSRTAGRWYKTDADNDYASSTANAIGFTTAAISSGSSGQILLTGRLTGLSGLTAGTLYYISATAGEITSSAPANKRAVGEADSTTSLLVGQWQVPNVWTNLPDASASQEGIVTTGAQTFAGVKTFSSPPVGLPTYSRCDTTLTKNANTTLENVSGLSFAVGASEVWAFQFRILAISAAAADYKFTLTGPSTPTAVQFGLTSNQGGLTGPEAATSFGSAVNCSSTGNNEEVLLSGLLRNGANAGTVQLQFAQAASNASDSKVFVESYVLAWWISS